jgi:hypothetical protein
MVSLTLVAQAVQSAAPLGQREYYFELTVLALPAPVADKYDTRVRVVCGAVRCVCVCVASTHHHQALLLTQA